MTVETKKPAVADLLKKLGFKVASAKLEEMACRKRKMALAYEHYRFLRPEKIKDFIARLNTKTMDRYGNYKTLAFEGIKDYSAVPPADVLSALETAQSLKAGDTKVFDDFQVAYIKDVPDPLLFGIINGCSDKFYIAGWDNDVKIEDILQDNEG